jgi:hypothetical protein
MELKFKRSIMLFRITLLNKQKMKRNIFGDAYISTEAARDKRAFKFLS